MKYLILFVTLLTSVHSYSQEIQKFYMVLHSMENVMGWGPEIPEDINRLAKIEYTREMYEWLKQEKNWLICKVTTEKSVDVRIYQGNVAVYYDKAPVKLRTCDTRDCAVRSFEDALRPSTTAENFWDKNDVDPKVEYGFRVSSEAAYLNNPQTRNELSPAEMPNLEIYSPSRHAKIPVVNTWYCAVFSDKTKQWVDHPFPLKSSEI